MRAFIFIYAFWLWCTPLAHADLYQWTDTDGVIHVVGEASDVPDAYREKLKVYRTTHAPATETRSATPLSPSRTYAEKSQGAFAQKIALDLGLIKSTAEDAFGPLSGAGIQPAGGWRASDPLTPEAQYEVLAAARRAADAQRLTLSADGAEAVVRQAATSFLPPPPSAQAAAPPPDSHDNEDPGYEEPVVIIEQPPPQVIEVVRDPVYIPLPVIVGYPRFPSSSHRRHHGRPSHHDHPAHHDQPAPAPAPLTGPFTPNPVGGPTHLPFGTSHMPFGASHMPFGSSQAR